MNTINSADMERRLQYKYAVILLDTGFCGACLTSSVIHTEPNYIEIPELGDYAGKYYNINGDHMWYHDAAFTDLWEECPSHNV